MSPFEAAGDGGVFLINKSDHDLASKLNPGRLNKRDPFFT